MYSAKNTIDICWADDGAPKKRVRGKHNEYDTNAHFYEVLFKDDSFLKHRIRLKPCVKL